MNNKMNNELIELNNEFKTIKTMNELNTLIDKMNDYGKGYVFMMKRSHFCAYGFDEIDSNKVSYLISDGLSIRESYIKNLHRNMIINDSSR